MYLPAEHAFGDKLPSIDQLKYLAGDFWYQFYQGQKDLYAIFGGLQQEFRQAMRRLHEITSLGNWHTASRLRHETFWPLLIDPNTVTKSPIVYGAGIATATSDITAK